MSLNFAKEMYNEKIVIPIQAVSIYFCKIPIACYSFVYWNWEPIFDFPVPK